MINALGGVRATIFAGLAVASMVTAGWQWVAKEHYKDKLDAQKLVVAELIAGHAKETLRITDEYTKALAEAERKRLDVERDLRSARLQLQDHWTCPDRDAGSADEATRLREEAAGRIVQIGAEADAQVKGLQKVNEDLRRSIEVCRRELRP